MDFIDILTFLQNYSLPTVIISVAISVIGLIFDKFLSDKFSLTVSGYAPFILGILFYFIYDLIFVSRFINLSEEVISAGILCGSIAGVIFSCVKHLVNGKLAPFTSQNEIWFSIEHIINNYVDKEKINTAVKEIKNIVYAYFKNEQKDDEETLDKIKEKLKEYSIQSLSDEEYLSVANLVLTAVKALKNS